MNCLVHMKEMYDELFNWGPGSGPKAAKAGRLSLMLYVELARLKLPRCNKCWLLIPKLHLMVHILEDHTMIAGNPIECWNYRDESEIGAARKVAESGHAYTLHRLVISKHRVSHSS